MIYYNWIDKCDDGLGTPEQYIIRDSSRISKVEPLKFFSPYDFLGEFYFEEEKKDGKNYDGKNGKYL